MVCPAILLNKQKEIVAMLCGLPAISPVLANAYVPFVATTPVMQIVLLVVIICIEAGLLLPLRRHVKRSRVFWLVAGANLVTALLGVGIAVVGMGIVAWLVFEPWSLADGQMGFILYEIFPQLLIWLVCYHISWRLEWWLLRDWGLEDSAEFRNQVRYAHRWTYGLLLVFVLLLPFGWFWYFF